MISLLFDASEEYNTFIDSLNLKDLLGNDEEDKEYPNNLNLNELFNGSLESKFKDNYHVRYEGSLTYSPCTEGVTWIIVLEKFKNLSSIQIQDLKMLVRNKNTARQIQAFNGRKLYLA